MVVPLRHNTPFPHTLAIHREGLALPRGCTERPLRLPQCLGSCFSFCHSRRESAFASTFAFAFVLAFLSVIPAGNLLFPPGAPFPQHSGSPFPRFWDMGNTEVRTASTSLCFCLCSCFSFCHSRRESAFASTFAFVLAFLSVIPARESAFASTFAFAFVLAFLSVIPAGNLLFPPGAPPWPIRVFCESAKVGYLQPCLLSITRAPDPCSLFPAI